MWVPGIVHVQQLKLHKHAPDNKRTAGVDGYHKTTKNRKINISSAKTGTPVNRDELVLTCLAGPSGPHYEQEGKKTDRRTCPRKEKKVHTQKNCSLKTD